MFGFLNTAALFAAAAALIPLIIHLFSRRRVKIVEFSSLKHLKAMQRRQVRRLRIRQLLLLLLRMLIILMVVLAFARPTTEKGSVGSHASVSAVILFDNSASMNRYVADGNLFDIAKRRTEELMETFGPADEVCLIPIAETAGAVESRVFTSPAIAAEQLAAVSEGYGEADLTSAIDNAVTLMDRSSNYNREVYIVSDRQRATLPEDVTLASTDANVYLVDLPLEDNDDLGVISLDFGGQLIQPGLDFNVTAVIKNYSSEPSSDRIASLFIDNNRVAQTDFRVDAGSEQSVTFTRSVSNAGFHSGYVQISDDRFPVDNRYYFSFRIPERFNLLIIKADPAAAYFNLALVPRESLSRFWSVKEVAPTNLAGVNFNDYDVVLLAGVPPLQQTYVSRLQSFVRRGNSLFVVYSAGTDINYFNEEWSQATGVTYDEPVKANFSREGFYTLGSIDMSHPIFSVFNFEAADPPEIKFYTLPKMRVTGKDATTLMRFSGDRPALVENRYGDGRVLTFTGPTSPEYADLVSQAFFVPFVSRTAEYLASDLSSLDLRLYAGDNITRTLQDVGAANQALELIAPDSTEYRLPPEESDGVLVVRPRPVNQPGIYSVQLYGKELDRFAVNVDPQECDLAAADEEQYARALGIESVRQLEPDAELAGMIATFRYGRELWQIFLWIAVVLVVAEMLLSRGGPPEE